MVDRKIYIPINAQVNQLHCNRTYVILFYFTTLLESTRDCECVFLRQHLSHCWNILTLTTLQNPTSLAFYIQNKSIQSIISLAWIITTHHSSHVCTCSLWDHSTSLYSILQQLHSYFITKLKWIFMCYWLSNVSFNSVYSLCKLTWPLIICTILLTNDFLDTPTIVSFHFPPGVGNMDGLPVGPIKS